ncbi:MAG TPA: GNAT family N-acetyltransferase [Methylomirabilota bacterium]|nr:GNAT family N-acetyltransferase [Methylomirabilota bacterium]
MKIRRVTELAAFEALGPIWGAVARESGQTSPFHSHEWFLCCWRAAAPDHRPEALVIEDAAGPAGLVPLVHWNGDLHGIPARFVGLLAAPDTPFVDWLAVEPVEPVIETVMKDLARREDWDVLELSGLPATSATVKAMEAWLSGRFRWHRAGVLHSPYLVVSGTWDAFWTAKSQRFKKTIRNVANRLVKAGAIAIEEHREVRPDGPFFAELLDVSRRSWKAPRQVAIATMPRMADFFADLTRAASARGWLRLWILRLDGRAVATEYQLEDSGRVHALRSEFDGSLPEDLSPGTHLNAEIVRALFGRAGVHEYDMGPGENEYKARWASDAHETVTLRIYRPGAYGATLYALEARAVPALKRLRRDDPA